MRLPPTLSLIRLPLLLCGFTLCATGCGDWKFRIPPPAAPAPIPPVLVVPEPSDPQANDALSEEVVLLSEPGPVTLPGTAQEPDAPPPLQPGKGGHFGRIPRAYRQRLSEEDAATANGDEQSRAKRPLMWPPLCGSGAIELERERSRERDRER